MQKGVLLTEIPLSLIIKAALNILLILVTLALALSNNKLRQLLSNRECSLNQKIKDIEGTLANSEIKSNKEKNNNELLIKTNIELIKINEILDKKISKIETKTCELNATIKLNEKLIDKLCQEKKKSN